MYNLNTNAQEKLQLYCNVQFIENV